MWDVRTVLLGGMDVSPSSIYSGEKKIKFILFYLNNKLLIDNKILGIAGNNLKDNKEKDTINIDNIFMNNINKNFYGPYLAGLIEGNGSIWVDENKYKKTPSIDIIFAEKDYPLCKHLHSLLNIGLIKPNKYSKAYMWHIKKIEDIYIILNLTNGYYRTPKYEAIIRAINWLNNYIKINNNKYIKNLNNYNNEIRELILKKIKILEIKPIDISDIWSNSWLTGFTDADGNFSIILSKRKRGMTLSLQYRLEIRQNYNKIINKDEINLLDKNIYNNYFIIMINIASMFNSNLYSRKRYLKLQKQQSYKFYYSYFVSVSSIINLKLVNDYFNKYPLLSSKYLDYKDWSKLITLILLKNKISHPECIDLAIKTRKNFNSTRTIFNWDHLNK